MHPMGGLTLGKLKSAISGQAFFVFRNVPFSISWKPSQLLLRVHHDWAVPGHWLLQRLSGDQQEADAIFAGLHGDFVAAVKQDQRAIIGFEGGAVSSQFTLPWTASGPEALQNLPDPAKT